MVDGRDLTLLNPATRIKALHGARVVKVGYEDGLGKVVALQFTKRRWGRLQVFTAYHAFMDTIAVRPGAVVRQGDLLGFKRGLVRPIVVKDRRGREVKALIYKGV